MQINGISFDSCFAGVIWLIWMTLINVFLFELKQKFDIDFRQMVSFQHKVRHFPEISFCSVHEWRAELRWWIKSIAEFASEMFWQMSK